MGNVHAVLQIAPLLSIEGAALRVRDDKMWELATEDLPKYVSILRHVPEFTIANVNVDSNHVRDEGRELVYVVIAGGGKWGYDSTFVRYLEANAACFHDARFFINDEYVSYIDEYAITNGVLAVERIVQEAGVLIDVVEARIRGESALYCQFAIAQAEQWLERGEPDGAVEWVDKAIATHPRAWIAHYLRARVLGAQAAHVQALESLEKARAGITYALAKISDDRVMVEGDHPDWKVPALQKIENALGDRFASLGRVDEALAAYDRSWAIVPMRENTAPMIGKALVLMTLGRYADAERCLADAMSLASSRRTIANVYYNRACIHACRGDIDRSIATLAQAIELEPSFKTMAREDDDFASFRDRPELHALLK